MFHASYTLSSLTTGPVNKALSKSTKGQYYITKRNNPISELWSFFGSLFLNDYNPVCMSLWISMTVVAFLIRD